MRVKKAVSIQLKEDERVTTGARLAPSGLILLP